MIENNSSSLNYETNVANIIHQAIDLFKDSGLNELAEKWDRILKNYLRKKSFR